MDFTLTNFAELLSKLEIKFAGICSQNRDIAIRWLEVYSDMVKHKTRLPRKTYDMAVIPNVASLMLFYQIQTPEQITSGMVFLINALFNSLTIPAWFVLAIMAGNATMPAINTCLENRLPIEIRLISNGRYRIATRYTNKRQLRELNWNQIFSKIIVKRGNTELNLLGFTEQRLIEELEFDMENPNIFNHRFVPIIELILRVFRSIGENSSIAKYYSHIAQRLCVLPSGRRGINKTHVRNLCALPMMEDSYTITCIFDINRRR
ncbi:MAG: hypothetical protein CMM93_04150 [Rickettsiales bacterium]|nr:hypothetical protein [Rickettsiales bacterium]